MQFHFFQDVYQKKQPGTNIRKKTHMITKVNIINGKASAASINGAWGSEGALSPLEGILGDQAPEKIFRL